MQRVVEAIEAGIGTDHIGAQLHVVRNGRVEADIAVGESRPGVALSPGTLMPWYSITKVIAAVAVIQQWDAGRLALDDPVARHVPEFATAGKEAVTVRHLLTHTAGLRESGVAPGELEDPSALVARIAAAELKPGWRPGHRAGYNGRAAFHILGEIVARLSGRPWADYVHEEIFERLGMENSWVALPVERFAAYGDRLAVMPVTRTQPFTPAAGADDPAVFAVPLPSRSGVGPMADAVRPFLMLLGRGLLDGERLLSAPAAEAMVARHRTGMVDETFGTTIDWGLGIMVNSIHYTGEPAPYGYGMHASRRAAGHGGAESAIAFFDPEAGLAAALAFNGLPGEARNHLRTQAVLTALYEELNLAPASGPVP